MTSKLLASAAVLFTAVFAVPAPQAQYNTASVVNNTTAPSITSEVVQATAPVSSFGGAGAAEYHGPAWLPKGAALIPKLDQQATNGRSKLGTSDADKLPSFITGGPEPNGYPWGSRTSQNSNYYNDPPDTGVTRYYDLTITRQTIAPDGVEFEGLVINGAFPGPRIEANWGDWISVTVTNGLEDEGTALHWHGLLQKATPWFDGVPGVDQCPIAPGQTLTYTFKADLYGTSWYHSHYSAQYASGISGPMIIYGPQNAAYDVDLGPVMLSDWYHSPYFALVEQTMAPTFANALPVMSNNVLINGKMNYPCANATGLKCTPNAGISKFYVESGKKYRLRLINSGAEGMQKFSIDGYKLTVIANDFVEIAPYEVDVVTLGVGQRSDVIFSATGSPTDAVWMRSSLSSFFDGGCSLPDGVSPEAVAAIYYQNANTSAAPNTTSTVSAAALLTCQNDDLSLTEPSYSLTPTGQPQTSQNLNIVFGSNGTHNVFTVDGSSFRANYNDPVLLDANVGDINNFPSDYNVYNFNSSKSIRLVIYNYAPTGAHPMHMHGHNMYILAVGSGTWDGTVTRPSNPQRRDVQLLPNAISPTVPSYIVVQIDADNPGVWPLHCHIAWHVSAGLYINILERPADILNFQIPSTMAQTCRDWDAWTAQHAPDEIDSGL